MISAETSDTRVRHDWSAREIRSLHDLPITELVYRVHNVRRRYRAPTKVLLRTLLSVRTGGRPEDCACCSQSAHYATAVSKEKLMRHAPAPQGATPAKAQRFNRLCLHAALRSKRAGAEFGQARSPGKIAVLAVLSDQIAFLKNPSGKGLVRAIGTPLQNAAPAPRAKNMRVRQSMVVSTRSLGRVRCAGLNFGRREMSDEPLARHAARAAAAAA